MKVVSDPRTLATLCRDWQKLGDSVGIVPTMGALHAGHRALMDEARSSCDRVVVSIFVNPTQFSEALDFENYPSSVELDLAMCERADADLVYLPDESIMYPSGFSTSIHVDRLTEAWEGADRPGHFDGVATVVTKLLAASRADRAFFGQKDFQQCAVVRRLIDDLDLPVEIVVCPTVRDADGLALSSRNERLSHEGRQHAVAIPAALMEIQRLFEAGEADPATLTDLVSSSLIDAGMSIHYLAIVDPVTLEPAHVARVDDVVIVAVSCDGVRLLDNHVLT